GPGLGRVCCGPQVLCADDGDGVEALPVAPGDGLEAAVAEAVALEEVIGPERGTEEGAEDLERRLSRFGFDAGALHVSVHLDPVDESQSSHEHRLSRPRGGGKETTSACARRACVHRASACEWTGYPQDTAAECQTRLPTRARSPTGSGHWPGHGRERGQDGAPVRTLIRSGQAEGAP